MTTFHKIKWVTLSGILILFVTAAIQNTGVTSVRFMGWEAEAPRVLLICGVGLGGFIAGVIVVLLIQRRHHHNHPAQDAKGESTAQLTSME